MIDIKFKVTTSKILKCSNCKRLLEGKKGFIKIIYPKKREWDLLSNAHLYLCPICWERFMKDIKDGKKTRIKDYKKLLRKRILMGLK